LRNFFRSAKQQGRCRWTFKASSIGFAVAGREQFLWDFPAGRNVAITADLFGRSRVFWPLDMA
jgi:hypothetical protein